MRKFKVAIDGRAHEVELLAKDGSHLSFSVAGETYSVSIEGTISTICDSEGRGEPPVRRPELTRVSASDGIIRAPMPGFVTSVKVSEGQMVLAGTTLLSIEAMKMENAIVAPKDGTVLKIHVQQGTEVQSQAKLVELK